MEMKKKRKIVLLIIAIYLYISLFHDINFKELIRNPTEFFLNKVGYIVIVSTIVSLILLIWVLFYIGGWSLDLGEVLTLIFLLVIAGVAAVAFFSKKIIHDPPHNPPIEEALKDSTTI